MMQVESYVQNLLAQLIFSFFDILIEKMTPTSNVKPKSVYLILDRYLRKESTKS